MSVSNAKVAKEKHIYLLLPRTQNCENQVVCLGVDEFLLRGAGHRNESVQVVRKDRELCAEWLVEEGGRAPP